MPTEELRVAFNDTSIASADGLLRHYPPIYSGFYDPDLNAYSCHFASDSSDNGTMWAYRYKNPKK